MSLQLHSGKELKIKNNCDLFIYQMYISAEKCFTCWFVISYLNAVSVMPWSIWTVKDYFSFSDQSFAQLENAFLSSSKTNCFPKNKYINDESIKKNYTLTTLIFLDHYTECYLEYAMGYRNWTYGTEYFSHRCFIISKSKALQVH